MPSESAHAERALSHVEREVKLAVALVVGAAVTGAGLVAAGAALHGAPWAAGVQAFALPLATLAGLWGGVDGPVATWGLLGGGYLLWTGIGYLVGAQLLRR